MEKDSQVEPLYTSVYDVIGSVNVMLNKSMNRLQFNLTFEQLTPRRKQVLKLLLAGVSDQAIAQSLHITPSTVRKHVENISSAFGLTNDFPDERRSKRTDLIALFAKYKPEMVNVPVSQEQVSTKSFRIQPVKNTASLSQPQQLGDYSSLKNRDVFILVDRSGSMVRKDEDTGNQSRYEYLAEVVEGHIATILSYETEGTNICDRLEVYFFSQRRINPHPIVITDASQVCQLFTNNKPKTKTFICPTLSHCIHQWLGQGKLHNRGAFFIIYTDGEFDDEQQFIHELASVCQHIDHHDEVKFFVLGLGKDIDIIHFLTLDFNVNKTMHFNVLVFDLVNEVEDILELLSRQLNGQPHLAFPNWVKIDYPEWVKTIIHKF